MGGYGVTWGTLGNWWSLVWGGSGIQGIRPCPGADALPIFCVPPLCPHCPAPAPHRLRAGAELPQERRVLQRLAAPGEQHLVRGHGDTGDMGTLGGHGDKRDMGTHGETWGCSDMRGHGDRIHRGDVGDMRTWGDVGT